MDLTPAQQACSGCCYFVFIPLKLSACAGYRSDSKPQEGGDVVNMVQLCNIVRYIKVCNHTDLLLRKFVIQVEWASPRRQDSRGLILPGDPRTREQQVLRLVVWGLII
jgi:hypothetical protein